MDKKECIGCLKIYDRKNLLVSGNEFVCRDCRTNYYSCDHCRKWVLINEIDEDDEYVEYSFVCSKCLEDFFTRCDVCERYELTDVIEETDEYLNVCRICIQTKNDIQYRDYDTSPTKYVSTDKGEKIQSLRNFGIELEVCFSSRDKAVKFSKSIAKEVGITTDGSISGAGLEIQTPLANGIKGEDLINKICKELQKNDFSVNRSCGFHLHIDTSDIETNDNSVTTYQLKALWLVYMAFEDVLLSFLPPSRKAGGQGARFCASLRNDYNFTEIRNVSSVDKLEKIWYRARTTDECNNAKGESKHSSRYRGINLHTLFTERHVEIRYHSGTTNQRKILEWINLHTLLVDVVLKGNVDLDFLAYVSANSDIHGKTNDFFLFFGKNLSASSRDYFLKRQETFMPKRILKISEEENKAVSELLAQEVEA